MQWVERLIRQLSISGKGAAFSGFTGGGSASTFVGRMKLYSINSPLPQVILHIVKPPILCNVFVGAYRDGSFAGFGLTKEEMLLVCGEEVLIAYPTYTIYHINMTPEIRAILLSFLIMPLKSCPTMAEFDYSNTILIVKPVGPDAAASLRSKHNTNRLKSFHFEDGVSSIAEYDDTRSRECTPYVSRPPELQLHQQFDPGPKDATQGFFFGTDEKKCDVQLLKNPDPDKNSKYYISRQHFRIDFNWDSGFLKLNNMSPTNGTRISAPSVKNGFQSLKYNNMHMLHPAEQTKIHVGTLVFEFFPFRGRCQQCFRV